MCIFLGLGDTSLRHVMCCQILTEGIGDLFFFECNGFVRDGLIVFREAYVGQIQTFFLSSESETHLHRMLLSALLHGPGGKLKKITESLS